MSECRSCHKPVMWVSLLPSGKRNPLDEQPVADGNIVLLPVTEPDGTRRAKVLKKDDVVAPGTDRYTSHFSTCPDSKGWRRSEPKAKNTHSRRDVAILGGDPSL